MIGEALVAAEPEGFVRLFIDIGPPVQDLLQRVELLGSAKGYARKLREAAGGGHDQRELAAGLSEREYEVLQLVAAGMSNQEIAEALIVALSTVKAHVRHVCQKLGVQKRVQAIAKARELGLL
ncbi:MAG: hypothetical protein J2P36_31425 [Ktedonobacteraceae bacterium]|nr:hypothetical protein [Ktedonobacteraceae bacterium]